MIRLRIEHVPTEEQTTYYCDTLKWASYDGHPYLLICKNNEYIEKDLLVNKPISISQVQDTPEEKELQLFDFLFSKNFDKTY